MKTRFVKMKYSDVHKLCLKHQNLKSVSGKLHFLQSFKGGYGEGDQALGINVPDSRNIAKQFKELPLAEVTILFKSPFHEERLIAIFILIHHYKRALKTKNIIEINKVYQCFWKCRLRVNNWDLVDALAPHISGHYYLHFDQKDLQKLIKSKNLWERRLAVVSMWPFIRLLELTTVLRVIEKRLYDKEDLMHKACGWMLRELGKRDVALLKKFLTIHAAKMPRTALRYSLEKFNSKDKKYFMELKRIS